MLASRQLQATKGQRRRPLAAAEILQLAPRLLFPRAYVRISSASKISCSRFEMGANSPVMLWIFSPVTVLLESYRMANC
jgi:hypothetical protein